MKIFTDFFKGLYRDWIGDKLDAIKTVIHTAIGIQLGNMLNTLNDIVSPLSTTLGVHIADVFNSILGALDAIKEAITGLPSIFTDIKQTIIDVKDKIPQPIMTFLELQTWINPIFLPLKGITKIYELLSGKHPAEVTWLGNVIGDGVKGGVKLVTDAALENLLPIFEDFMSEQNIPEGDREKIRLIAGSGEFGLNSVVGFMLGHFLSPVLSTSLAPAWETMAQQVWSIAPNRLVDPNTLTRLKYRGLITDASFKQEMGFHGYNSTRQKAFTDDYLFLPTVGDVIRWGVREAFYDDYAAEYSLDDEYPSKLDEYGVKLGIEHTELKYFWRSHWELPSLRMGYEMLHRDVIGAEDLDKLFMATDILPWWRDKLKAISYKPYTRVDVRRMYKAGVINRDTVKRTYLDLGYDEDHAENLTTWAIMDSVSKERDLTRSQFERLYKDGQITREQAAESLVSLGYDEDESNLILTLVDIKLEDELEKEQIALWVEQFRTRIITLSALTSSLDTLTITEEKKQRIIAKATRLSIGFITLPAKTDLTKWYSLGIIDDTVFKAKMGQLGYIDEDINYYLLGLAESE